MASESIPRRRRRTLAGRRWKALAVTSRERNPPASKSDRHGKRPEGLRGRRLLRFPAPANLPRDVSAKLSDAFRQVLANPDIRNRMITQGADRLPGAEDSAEVPGRGDAAPGGRGEKSAPGWTEMNHGILSFADGRHACWRCPASLPAAAGLDPVATAARAAWRRKHPCPPSSGRWRSASARWSLDVGVTADGVIVPRTIPRSTRRAHATPAGRWLSPRAAPLKDLRLAHQAYDVGG
jgi:hypothetical protein